MLEYFSHDGDGVEGGGNDINMVDIMSEKETIDGVPEPESVHEGEGDKGVQSVHEGEGDKRGQSVHEGEGEKGVQSVHEGDLNKGNDSGNEGQLNKGHDGGVELYAEHDKGKMK